MEALFIDEDSEQNAGLVEDPEVVYYPSYTADDFLQYVYIVNVNEKVSHTLMNF